MKNALTLLIFGSLNRPDHFNHIYIQRGLKRVYGPKITRSYIKLDDTLILYSPSLLEGH